MIKKLIEEEISKKKFETYKTKKIENLYYNDQDGITKCIHLWSSKKLYFVSLYMHSAWTKDSVDNLHYFKFSTEKLARDFAKIL